MSTFFATGRAKMFVITGCKVENIIELNAKVNDLVLTNEQVWILNNFYGVDRDKYMDP